MGQPPEVIKRRFPDFDEQVRRMQERLAEDLKKEGQRRIDILTGKRITEEEDPDEPEK